MMHPNRRRFLQASASLAALAALPKSLQAADAPAFTLEPLPYAADALEPHIDALTMTIHHGKHHAGYIANLNTALSKAPGLAGKSLSEILVGLPSAPEEVRTALRNNAGGHANHSLFWETLSPNGGGEPKGELADAIGKAFGSFAAFQEKFADAGMKRFGSGWAWLIARPNAGLEVVSTPNQDSPAMTGTVDGSTEGTPLLGLDVWEHAYYLKYQNRRADYIKSWWNVVNWAKVSELFQQA